MTAISQIALFKQELARTWSKFQSLNYFERSGVCAVFASLFLLPLWEGWSSRQQVEMQNLYYSASAGNLESVRELSRHTLPGSTRWLEKLADDRDADAHSRVAAIDSLLEKRFADPGRIAPLLWIRVPFVVRDEASLWFMKRGCTQDCIRMALDSLHALWNGRATLEMQLDVNAKGTRADDDEYTQQLLQKTEANYLALLKNAPCTCRRYLRSDYSADQGFSARVENQLGTACVDRS